MQIRYRVWIRLALFFLAAYICFFDHLPPRTPRKIASRISHLKIPFDVEVAYMAEHWDFNDGYAKVALKLSPESSEIIESQIKEMAYKPLADSPALIDSVVSLSIAHSVVNHEELSNRRATVIWDRKNRLLYAFVIYI